MGDSTAIFNSSPIHGDAVFGDKYQAPLTSLETAIQAIKTSIEHNPILEDIIEELAEYTTDRPDRTIIGLEEKLKQGGRFDLIENAVYQKNRFERKMAKQQMSLVEQRVCAHVLSAINTLFNQKIRPLILEDSKKSTIDQAIHDEIIDPVYKAIVGFDSSMTTEYVCGMLYSLTGKCHLLWSKQC